MDPAGQLELAGEALEIVGVIGIGRAQELEGDDRSALLVAGAPDHAHATAAQLGQEGEGHGVSFVTVFEPLFATQMFVPSNATALGLTPTR